MKRKIMIIGAAGIAVTFIAFGKLYVKADESIILKSRGNIMVENAGAGSIALYSSDIYYLQDELDSLTKELYPDIDTDENMNMTAEEE